MAFLKRAKAGKQSASAEMRGKIRALNEGVKVFPVYLLYGDETFLSEQLARRIVDLLLPKGEREFGFESLSGAAVPVSELTGALATAPFLGGKRVVWLRGCGLFRTSARAEAVRENLPPAESGVTAVITEEDIDRRLLLFKEIDRSGFVCECRTLSDTDDEDLRYIYELVSERLAETGAAISRDVLFHLIQLVGTSLRSLFAELEKLSLYAKKKRKIERGDIDLLVSPRRETEAYQLAEAVAVGDLRGSLKILRQVLAQGGEALGVIELLARRIRFLLQARELMDAGTMRTAPQYPAFKSSLERLPASVRDVLPPPPRGKRYSLFSQHPYVAYKLFQAARDVPSSALRAYLGKVSKAESACKGGGRSPREVLEDLVIDLCGGRAISGEAAR